MTSPIEQVKPNSLEAIFNKNPLELTDAEIDIITAELRAKRATWTPDVKKNGKVAASLDLTMEDLGL